MPVKDTRRGKSRLELPPEHRVEVVRALVLDTLDAVVGAAHVGPVLVVAETIDDARTVAEIPGVRTHLTTVRSLNGALLDGLRMLDGPVAVLPADLPGLRSVDLDAALEQADAWPQAVVADRDGTGTTLLTAQRPAWLHPHYGPGSFLRHVAAGAVALNIPTDSSLRHDVDLPADSDALGPRSSTALRRARHRPDCA